MTALVRDARSIDIGAPLELRRHEPVTDVWSPVDDDTPTSAGSDGGSSQTPSPTAGPVGLPWAARIYVASVVLAGAALVAAFFPTTVPDPALSAGLLTLVLVSSAFKVRLPVTGTSATMSASFIADFMSLILLGPEQAMLFAGAGAWFQCLVNRPQPKLRAYRVLFSIAALMVTVQVTNLAYTLLGGSPGTFNFHDPAAPVVGGAFAYFVCNAALVAIASALATRQSAWRVWNDSFLSSGPSFFAGAGVAVAAAWFIDQGQGWSAIAVAVPAYLTYRTYREYLGRIDDEQRHVAEMSALNIQAMRALDQARRSERALAIEKTRLAVTLGTIGEAVVACDTRGRVVLLNQMAETFTGWPQEQAVGTPAADVFRLIDRETSKPYANPVDKVLRTQSRVDRDNHAALVARDGTHRLVEHSATPVHDQDGTVVAVVLVARDTTDAVRLEAERARAGKLASLGVLAGGIAHDFNNILTAIVGNISLAQLDDPTASQRNTLGEAEKACLRAKNLTHQLLTFAKGGAPLKKQVFLQDIIRDAVSFALRGSNVRCELKLADDLWAVEVDENQFVQVINNLILNGVQAMPDGGVIEVRADNITAVSKGDGASGPQVRLSFQDHGVGIPEAHVGKIFDPYFTTKAKGSGLGLATVYSVVTNHGGNITVQSDLGLGTTMTVTLPAVAGRSRSATSESHGALERGHGRVLIMDDEVAVREVARAMLSRLGYRVDVAADGRAAIELYSESLATGDRFAVVIMDLTIPGGMGGKDAIHVLRSVDPSVRAIVSSGYADDPVMSQYEQYGFNGVVPKPFTIADLGRQIQQVLAQRA